MALAKDVAVELRKLADALDVNPEQKLVVPTVAFWHHTAADKSSFLAMARMLPRPFAKKVREYSSGNDIELKHQTDNIRICLTIPQSLTCTLIQPARPAVYDCDPILSVAEESMLSQ